MPPTLGRDSAPHNPLMNYTFFAKILANPQPRRFCKFVTCP